MYVRVCVCACVCTCIGVYMRVSVYMCVIYIYVYEGGFSCQSSLLCAGLRLEYRLCYDSLNVSQDSFEDSVFQETRGRGEEKVRGQRRKGEIR